MPRDNFTDATKKLLAGKVGYRCSNPFCRCATVGSNEDGSGIITIGQAAHITAAEVNGPRYDATLTSRERRAESNGIWLCCNHARMIDRDPDFFTVQLLEKWKRDAEKEANEKIQGINTRDLSFTLKIIYDDLQASYEAVEKVKSTDMNIVFPASMLFVPDEYENKIALISDQIGLDNASRIRKCFRAITEFKNMTSEESKRYKKTLGRIADIQAIKYGHKLFEFYERIDEYDLKGLIETIGLIFNEKDAK